MPSLRLLLLKHPLVAAAVVLTALVLRLAVPAGFMPVVAQGGVTLALCSGYGPTTAVPPMAHTAMPGMAHHDGDAGGGAQSPCAFADLALPVVAGTDPVLLATALAFILLTAALAARPLPPRPAARLRPPLRGPPLPA